MKSSRSQIVTGAFLLVFSIGCGKIAQHELQDLTIPSPAQTAKAVLGKGYDSVQERFSGDCVRGDTQYVGTSESFINFDRSLSEKETADSLGFSIGGKARYNAMNYSASAKFASSAASSEYSESTIYSSSYKYKNAKLKYKGLTEVGRAASQGSSSYVWENWQKTCGHEFVEQIELGAKLFISAKVDFATKEDKSAFNAKFKVKGPAFSASSELKQASRIFGKSASVSIRAYQLGGDVSRLSAIFSDSDGSEVQEERKDTHSLLVCSMDRIDACLDILDSALRYATDLDDPQSFPNQIHPNYDPSKPDGPVELSYMTKPWSDLAFYPPPPIIAGLVKESRSHLSRMFEKNLNLRERVSALLTGPFRLSASQRKKAKSFEDNIVENFTKINKGAVTCYQDIDSCVEEVNNISKTLHILDPNELAILPEIYSQWCDLLQGGNLNKPVKNITLSLYEAAGRIYNLEESGDPCGMAEAALVEMRYIDLSDQNIQSLAPIKSLPNLVGLNLSRNREILDYHVLQNLPILTELNLNSNRLPNASFFRKMTGLKRLDIARTGSTYLGFLNKLKEIQYLNVGDNPLGAIDFVTDLKKLEKLVANNTQLPSLPDFSQNQRLGFLDLSYNNINDFKGLISLESLSSLDVNDNPEACPEELKRICIVPL